jgi:hypothetical protein
MVEIPRICFEVAPISPTLTRRLLQHMNEGVEQCWKKWMHLVFQEKLMSRAWKKVKSELTEGGLQKMMMRPIG